MGIQIIAEIAQGYEGIPYQAILLARAGVNSGADSIKFHCVYADDTCVPGYKHYDFFKSLEMPIFVWQQIHDIVREGGKNLILNLGGDKSFQLAKSIGVNSVKFHSTHFFCNDLISKSIAQFDKIFVSIGGISENEIEWFIDTHKLTSETNVSFTYGFQASPTPLEKNNLLKLSVLYERFKGFKFGFEDHADAFGKDKFHVPLLALGLGASHIEKHLTLDPLLKIEDAESALSISEFVEFSDLIRRLEPALGSGTLALTKIENDYRQRVLKVVVSSEELNVGVALTKSNLSLKRPAEESTDAYLRIEDVVDKKLRYSIAAHTVIKKEMLT